MENRSLVVGDDHLEVVSPVEEHTTAGRWLERQGGDAGYMKIFQCDNLAERRVHFAELGVRTVWTSIVRKRSPATCTRRMRGAPSSPSIKTPSWDGWHRAGPSWSEQREEGWASGFAAARLASPAPDALAGPVERRSRQRLKNTRACPASPSMAPISLRKGPRKRSWGLDSRFGQAARLPAPTTIAGVRFTVLSPWPSAKPRAGRPRRYSPGPRRILGQAPSMGQGVPFCATPTAWVARPCHKHLHEAGQPGGGPGAFGKDIYRPGLGVWGRQAASNHGQGNGEEELRRREGSQKRQKRCQPNAKNRESDPTKKAPQHGIAPRQAHGQEISPYSQGR